MKLTPRRLLSISAVLMLLTALAHTVGNLMPASDPGLIGMENSMRNSRFDVGMGMNPSMFDFYMLLVLAMSVTFVGLGVLNLVIARARDVPDSLVRRLIWINAMWVVGFTALGWFYKVPPPLIFGVIIEIPLLGGLLVQNRS